MKDKRKVSFNHTIQKEKTNNQIKILKINKKNQKMLEKLKKTIKTRLL